ncbi:nuclease HARBI1 [Labeo rohita]|uniref:Nuclease HARBI1 n=1 Tax=Labeo rohita TaxID=84645 RepID=A0A498NBI9_LABRO|nr:nuclease HARBI1 [Labeo rohita]
MGQSKSSCNGQLLSEELSKLGIAERHPRASHNEGSVDLTVLLGPRISNRSCLGSIDGKHVVIQAPNNSGSLFYNYKGTFSIVLLAVVDAKYCFRIIDVGSYGKTSDGGTLANSPFGNGLRNGTLCLPEDTLLPGADHLGPQPHVFIADEAFPLRRDLMRPFPGTTLPSRHRVFNYRLSRARLTVENTFGILAAQWRIYRLVIGVSPANAEACVKATCVLHNFLWRTTGTVRYPLTPAADGEASALQNVSRVGSNNAAREAMHVRESLADYFCAEGAVPWQPQV